MDTLSAALGLQQFEAKNGAVQQARLVHELEFRLGIQSTRCTLIYHGRMEGRLAGQKDTQQLDEPCFMLRRYVYFDARRQEFDYQLGITNAHLCRLMGLGKERTKQSAAERTCFAQIANCFSMLNIDGTKPTTHDLVQRYKGHFTPEFYPRRFVLKDPLYSQHLPTIRALLKNVLATYQMAHVRYVEFSLGINDLLSPWVYKHLIHPDVCEPLPTNNRIGKEYERGQLKTLLNDVDVERDQAKRNSIPGAFTVSDSLPPLPLYTFLIGLDRTQILLPLASNGILGRASVDKAEALHYLIEQPHAASKHSLHQPAYELFLKQCERILRQLGPIANHKRLMNVPQSMAERIVGLDLSSDELGYPYCPFFLDQFISLAQRLRLSFRIHCGEGVLMKKQDPLLRRALSAHLDICMHSVRRLKAAGVPCRIGHGVALLYAAVRDSGTIPSDEISAMPDSCYSPSNGTTSEDGLASVVPNPAGHLLPYLSILSRDVPIEINLTSNSYLIHDPSVGMSDELRGAACILSTDDDGIWAAGSCDLHNRHVSVAREYCVAIREGIIKSELQLQKFLDLSLYHAFYPRPTYELTDDHTDNNMGHNAGSIQEEVPIESVPAHLERVLPLANIWNPAFLAGARPFPGIILPLLLRQTEVFGESVLSPELLHSLSIPEFLESTGFTVTRTTHHNNNHTLTASQSGSNIWQCELDKSERSSFVEVRCSFVQCHRKSPWHHWYTCFNRCTSSLHREVRLRFCSRLCCNAHHLPLWQWHCFAQQFGARISAATSSSFKHCYQHLVR